MAVLKESMYIEFKGSQISQKDLFVKARHEWKNKGNKVKDLATVNIYYKPEEQMCYYVMNEGLKNEMTGSFEI